MIVVSNTSPLTSLAAIGHFDLLRELFGQIHIADGVWQAGFFLGESLYRDILIQAGEEA